MPFDSVPANGDTEGHIGEPQTITLAEAAKRLGVSLRVTRRAAAAGELPAIRIGRRWLILRRPFDELLSRGSGYKKGGNPM